MLSSNSFPASYRAIGPNWTAARSSAPALWRPTGTATPPLCRRSRWPALFRSVSHLSATISLHDAGPSPPRRRRCFGAYWPTARAAARAPSAAPSASPSHTASAVMVAPAAAALAARACGPGRPLLRRAADRAAPAARHARSPAARSSVRSPRSVATHASGRGFRCRYSCPPDHRCSCLGHPWSPLRSCLSLSVGLVARPLTSGSSSIVDRVFGSPAVSSPRGRGALLRSGRLWVGYRCIPPCARRLHVAYVTRRGLWVYPRAAERISD